MEWLIDCFHTCIISIPAPLFKREGMLLRVSCIFVSDGVKTELQGEDGARSGALGLAGGLLASESCNFTSTAASKTCILQRRRIFFKNSLVHAFPLDGGAEKCSTVW